MASAAAPPPGASPQPPAGTEQALAMQMMNVAMQLLQSKGGGSGSGGSAPMPAGGDGGALAPPVAAGGAHGWPQGTPSAHLATADESDAAAMHGGQQSGQLERGGSAGDAQALPQSSVADGVPVDTPAAPPPAPAGDEAAPATTARMGFKPQAAQMGAYAAAMGSQGFSFPPWGGMPAGWPPAEMTDHTLDSKLRPPAA